MKVSLISAHDENWYAGASTVYMHLHRDLCASGVNAILYHLPDYAARGVPAILRKYASAFSLSRKLKETVISSDVVEVAGGNGWKLFKELRQLPSDKRPLLVTRLHGLSFKDEQARICEEIAQLQSLSWQYKYVNRHWINWQEFESIRLADIVICHTSREVDAIVAAKLKPEREVEWMPLGVDNDFFVNEPHSGDGHRLLWWGSWLERKGMSSLPRAFELARRSNSRLTLTLGGTSLPKEEILSYFPAADRAHITVLPHVSHEEHISLLRSHDILLFPSLSEGFGLALLEAMAAGIPSVTTFTGMAHDFLVHGVNCVLVPMNGPTAVARSIVELSENSGLRQKLAANGVETAKKLTWRKTAESTIEVYDRFLKSMRNSNHSGLLQDRPSSIVP